MNRHDRNKEKINLQNALEDECVFLEEMLRSKLQCCTEHQEAICKTDNSSAHEWFEMWKDTMVVLYKKQQTKHKCCCFDGLYHFTVKHNQSFREHIWGF
jgi:hypothetical protein